MRAIHGRNSERWHSRWSVQQPRATGRSRSRIGRDRWRATWRPHISQRRPPSRGLPRKDNEAGHNGKARLKFRSVTALEIRSTARSQKIRGRKLVSVLRKKSVGQISRMFILLNGSFGIGKTTLADLLARSIPGAVIYDPERVGFVLRRLPAWMLGLTRQPPDYQDLAIWRRLIAIGARRKRRRAPVVIVPMAFTNAAYLDGFAEALSTAAPVHRLCLVAPLEVVRARLTERANIEGRDITEFELRRSQECVEAHRDPHFGVPIDATKEPAEIVAGIRGELHL